MAESHHSARNHFVEFSAVSRPKPAPDTPRLEVEVEVEVEVRALCLDVILGL